MSNPAIAIAETIQTASIKRHPSPHHDLNPSTAASRKEPVTVSAPSEVSDLDDEIPESVIQPQRRKTSYPPLPDLRFEQSYLASIREADTTARVAWITIRDQLLLPLIQGTLWTLALQGWRHWNKSASYSGATFGSRIRRWWYGVNNWKIPGPKKRVSPRAGLAGQISDFYQHQFSSGGGD